MDHWHFCVNVSTAQKFYMQPGGATVDFSRDFMISEENVSVYQKFCVELVDRAARSVR